MIDKKTKKVDEREEVTSTAIDNITSQVNIIAIVLKNYSKATYSTESYHSRILKSYRRGEVIFNREDILELKSMDAPIKIYCEVC
jgi:hypothetical protein